jgi:hypothetical protein
MISYILRAWWGADAYLFLLVREGVWGAVLLLEGWRRGR